MSKPTQIMPRRDAYRFLNACHEVLRGGDIYGDAPAFWATIEWLWDQTNNCIGQLYSGEPLKLHALRQPKFAVEMLHQAGGGHPSSDDYLAMRDRLIGTLEEALATAPKDSPSGAAGSIGLRTFQ
jgi:hypothetical protein